MSGEGSDWLSSSGVSLEQIQKVVDAAARGGCRRFADEIFCEVLFRLQRILRDEPDKCGSANRLLNYAYKIALNDCKRKATRSKRENALPLDDIADLVKEEEQPTQVPSKQQFLDALDGEAPELREIVRFFLEGVTQKDIAKRLGLSEPTVTRRFQAARDILRRKLGGQFGPAA